MVFRQMPVSFELQNHIERSSNMHYMLSRSTRLKNSSPTLLYLMRNFNVWLCSPEAYCTLVAYFGNSVLSKFPLTITLRGRNWVIHKTLRLMRRDEADADTSQRNRRKQPCLHARNATKCYWGKCSELLCLHQSRRGIFSGPTRRPA